MKIKKSNSIFKLRNINSSLYKKQKSIRSVLNRNIFTRYQYYKDPSFFNNTNIDNQLNSMNSILHNEKLKSQSTKELLSTENSRRENYPNIKIITNLKELKKKKKEDLLFYKKIFKAKHIWKSQPKKINNLLNIRYAETERIYEKEANKENEILKSQGKSPKKFLNYPYINEQLNEIKSKIKFVKCIEDYAYPGIIISKIKSIENMIRNGEKKKRTKFIKPFEKKILLCKIKENEKRIYLCEAINITQ